MRSLNLSGLIRRNSGRPSLKQRAAALKATASKVIRRPVAPASGERLEDRPGFMPYPSDAPKGWLNIRYALKAEGERLLQIALREMDRRLDGIDNASDDEKRSHETRLRRDLRIDALTALSGRMDPSDKPLPEPGSEAAMAAFHAACGETTRLMSLPINGYPELRRDDGSFWMKHSLGRALEDGTITVSEFARLLPLAAEREHRDDAALLASNIGVLHALAYANEYPQQANEKESDDASSALQANASPGSAAAATPERVEPAGDDLSHPGFVTFEDASGATHRDTVERWISFMAARLNGVARQEMSRAFNVACKGLTQEECRPIENRLRRDLRLDALHDLAFRWQDVFEVNRECTIGHRWRMPSNEAPKYDLSACTLPQLARLYEAWNGLSGHISACGSVPCFMEDDDFTPAGSILDREWERASGFLDVIAGEARERIPKNEDERGERLNVLIRHDLNGNGRIIDAALLADLATTAEA